MAAVRVRPSWALSSAAPELSRGEVAPPGVGIRASREVQQGVSGRLAGAYTMGKRKISPYPDELWLLPNLCGMQHRPACLLTFSSAG